MNPDTGHLIESGDTLPEGYLSIPRILAEEAQALLEGKPEVYVDLKKKTPLTKWAKQQRKIRRKMAKKSRKMNRRKA